MKEALAGSFVGDRAHAHTSSGGGSNEPRGKARALLFDVLRSGTEHPVDAGVARALVTRPATALPPLPVQPGYDACGVSSGPWPAVRLACVKETHRQGPCRDWSDLLTGEQAFHIV